MNSKVWLIVFGVVSLLAIGGAGYYAYSSYQDYSVALDRWENNVTTIESLERRVPFPSKENAEALAKEVASYEASVKNLYETLNGFQKTLNTKLRNTDFQQLVSSKVSQFRKDAQKAGLTIETDTDFQLGFDAYASSVPAQDLVPILDYELEAIDHLLRRLMKFGVKELISFERDPIPGEAGGSESHDSGVVHKYPVRLRFKGTHDAFQELVNELANEKQFFYIVRVLKVKNQVTTGPHKLATEDGGFTKYENPITKEIATPEMIAEWSEGGATQSQIEANAKEAGFINANVDARILMGEELLEVFMVVDITRFLSSEEVAQSNPEPEVKKGRR